MVCSRSHHKFSQGNSTSQDLVRLLRGVPVSIGVWVAALQDCSTGLEHRWSDLSQLGQHQGV